MAFLVRKILLPKWKNPSLDNEEPIPADAITLCLKTSDNELSVWHIEDTSEEKVEDAVLALAGAQENCQTFRYLILEESAVRELGLELNNIPGKTAIKGLAETHRNIISLDYDSLGRLATLIRNKIARQEYGEVTMGNVKGKLKSAIENGKVEEALLHLKMRRDLGLPVNTCTSCGTLTS